MAQSRRSPSSLTKFSPSSGAGAAPSSSSRTTETTLANFRSRLDTDANNAGIRTLQRQMDILRGELEREQNLRRTERQRHDQVVSRLRQQMEFSLEEVKDYKSMLEEQQESAKTDRETMEGQLTKTVDLLKELEEENRQLLKERNERQHNEQQLRLMKESKALVERRIDSSSREIEQLRQALVAAEKRAIEAEQALKEQKMMGDDIMEASMTADSGSEDDNAHYGGVSPERKRIAQSIISKRQQKDREPSTADEFIDAAYGISPDKKRQKRPASSTGKSNLESPVSSAPQAILTELNNTRLSLQDSERKNRTLTRQLEAQKEKCLSLLEVEHELERCKEKLSLREMNYQKLIKEMSHVDALKEQWKECQETLQQLFPSSSTISTLSPPDVSALTRQVKVMKQQMNETVTEKNKLEMEMKSLQRHVARIDTDATENKKTISKLLSEKKEHNRTLLNLQAKVNLATAAENIAKKEAESMRQLIDTFETEEKQGSGHIANIGQASPGREGLTSSLRKAREDMETFKEAAKKAQDELDVLQKQYTEDKQKHETVLVKFGKLREALMEEREKAAKAETRAIKAETLVGKGMFNTDTTRALHLKQNPLLDALRERHEKQVVALKATIEQQRLQLDGRKGSSPASATAVVVTQRPDGKCSCGFDEKKLNQRLKESFKEQIGIFREGVYLITGYKVDMTFSADCPQFKVRSLFGERESDHLMFKWPVAEAGKGRASAPSSLDLMSSDFAEQCTKMDEFQYLSEYKSIPAFMSALTLKLFESTTICH